MKRIIWHWSAGGHKANATDKKHYHIIIEGDGRIVRGDHAIGANEVLKDPNDSSTYAAHTKDLNTGSIGVALAAMRGAKERPFDAGPSPITQVQIYALVNQTASLCRQFNIPVTRQTVLSHAEVEPTLGVKQRNKWDITWLPGMTKVGDPIVIGDALRAKVERHMRPAAPRKGYRPPTTPRAPVASQRPAQRPGGFLAALLRLFRGDA